MGFLDLLLGSKVSNPALVSAMEAAAKDPTDELLVDVWQKLLKAKVLLATTADGKEGFKRLKQPREAVALPFTTVMTAKSEAELAVFTDNAALEAYAPGTPFVAVTGEDAFTIAAGKNYGGLILNPNSASSVTLRCWQYAIFVEHVSEATKLQAMAAKYTRAGNHADAEGVLKAAIACSQRDPGPQHPFTGELNLELARAMRAQGKLNESEWVYRRALSIYEVAGSCDLEVGSVSEALGSLYIENNKASQAAPLLVRALEIYENVPGSKPDNVSRILCQLADLRKEEDTAEAEQYYKRASVILEERKLPEAVTILNKAAGLLEQMDKPKEALHTYLRSISLNQTIKRVRELDLAFASHRVAAIQIALDEITDAESHLDKALDLYKQAGGSRDALASVEALKTQLEENQSKAESKADSAADQKKSRFGVPGKRPADLPLLDMSQVKNNPRATVGGAPAVKPDPKPLNAEEEALEQMKAFLDGVGAERPAPKETPKEAPKETPKDAATDAVVDAIVQAEAVEASTVEEAKVEEPKAEEPKAEEPKEEPKLFDKPIDGEISMVFNSSVLGQLNKDDRFDKPIGERLKEKQEPEEAKVEEPKVEEAKVEEPKAEEPAPEPPKQEEKKNLFDAKVDGEISMFFNKSVLSDIKKDDRFDKPINARAEAEAKPEPESDSVSSLFEEKELDDSLGDAFASLMAEPKTTDGRFDRPISERLKENSIPPTIPPAVPPVPKPESVAPKAEAPKAEDESKSALFDDSLEDSLGSAFAALLTDPSKADDRFEKPIGGRAIEEPKPQVKEPEPVKEPEVSSEALLKQGTSLVQQQKLDEAIKIFDRVTKMSPNDVKAWYCKGSTLHLKNQFEDALYCFNHVLNLDVDNTKAMLRKAECLSKLGRGDQAIVIYDRLLMLQPKFVAGWLSKARALLQMRKLKEALECYQHVLTLEPNNEEATKAKNLISSKLGAAAH